MADSSGVLVSNAVGDGLEISSGQLQVKQDSSGTGVNLQTVTDAGSTTTNPIQIGSDTADGNGFTINGGVGQMNIRRDGSSAYSFRIFKDGNTDSENTVWFKNDGSAEFKGFMQINQGDAFLDVYRATTSAGGGVFNFTAM